MIELRDIKNSLIVLLSSEFQGVHIVADDISQIKQEGGLKAFPLMHIDFTNFNSVIFDTYTRNETILVDISYLEEQKPSSEKLYEIEKRLGQVIGAGLYVKDRFLHITDYSISVVDDTLHFIFNINFNNASSLSTKANEKEDKFGALNLVLK